MLKLTKKRCINKRTASKALASIRRKRMISRRKHQVGGKLITLPKEITFHIYPQPDKNFTDSDDCAHIHIKCDENIKALKEKRREQPQLDPQQTLRENARIAAYEQNISDCLSEISNCDKLSIICPAKWYTVLNTGEDAIISAKIPKYFEVKASSRQGNNPQVSDSLSVLDVLDNNYNFTIIYSDNVADYYSYHITTVLGATRLADDIHALVNKSQTNTLSLMELRKIMNYFFYMDKRNFVQYIGEWTPSGQKTQVIAWTDIFTDKNKIEDCTPLGQHSSKQPPMCTNGIAPTLDDLFKIKDKC
jgi:hypothetical protein